MNLSLTFRSGAIMLASGMVFGGVAPQQPMRVDPFVLAALHKALAKPGAELEYRLVTAESRARTRPRGAVRDSSSQEWLTLSDKVLVTLSDADSITIRFGPTGGIVMFHPKPVAAQVMLDVTRRNVGHRMAILLNGVLVTAPGIAGEWSGRWGVAAGTDPPTGRALVARLEGARAAR